MNFSQFSNKINFIEHTLPALEEEKEIIDFAVAQPELTIPYQITESFERLLREPHYNYYPPVNGIPELRQCFAKWASRDYGFAVSAENIAITVGARGGIMVLAQAILNPNDEVIIPAPHWSRYPMIFPLTGAVPKHIILDEEGFIPLIDQLNRAFTPRTKMLILNNPHNPTGVVWDQKTLSDILTWAEKKNVFVLVDEVCRLEIFDNTVFTPVASLTSSFKNLAVVRSFSKTLAIPGWRVGWVIGDPTLIKQIKCIQEASTGGTHSVTQYVLAETQDCLEPLVQQQLPIHQERRDVLYNTLSKHHGFRTIKPQGGLCAFTNIRYYLGNEVGGEVPQTSKDFTDIIYKKIGVILIDGISLGLDGFVRFCFTKDVSTIQKAITRMGSILEK